MRPETYIAQSLSVYFNGKSLPRDLSEFVRKLYKKGVPNFVKGKPFYTTAGLEVASNFNKVVVTDFGAYVELDTGHINLENIIASKQKDGKQHLHKLYVDRDGTAKFYYQLNPQSPSEFTGGNIYVSVYDVIQYGMDEVTTEQNHKSVKFELPDEIKNLMKK